MTLSMLQSLLVAATRMVTSMEKANCKKAKLSYPPTHKTQHKFFLLSDQNGRILFKSGREMAHGGGGGDNLTELFLVPLSITATSAFLTKSATIHTKREENPKMERGEFQSGG